MVSILVLEVRCGRGHHRMLLLLLELTSGRDCRRRHLLMVRILMRVGVAVVTVGVCLVVVVVRSRLVVVRYGGAVAETRLAAVLLRDLLGRTLLKADA